MVVIVMAESTDMPVADGDVNVGGDGVAVLIEVDDLPHATGEAIFPFMLLLLLSILTLLTLLPGPTAPPGAEVVTPPAAMADTFVLPPPTVQVPAPSPLPYEVSASHTLVAGVLSATR